MTTNHITAGFSQQVISPEEGIALAGYFNNRYNEGIHDDLYTKAMVLSDGDTAAALVVADIMGVPALALLSSTALPNHRQSAPLMEKLC